MAHKRPARSAVALGRRRLDPMRTIVLHYVTDGPARGWLHTHGLAAHGKPELEMRNVPGFLRTAASGVLNDLAGYLLNDAPAPLLPGELVEYGSATICVLAATPDADQGYDPAHYEGCDRLVLVDSPNGACECEVCATSAEPPTRLPN